LTKAFGSFDTVRRAIEAAEATECPKLKKITVNILLKRWNAIDGFHPFLHIFRDEGFVRAVEASVGGFIIRILDNVFAS
jgi:hypothetical protein